MHGITNPYDIHAAVLVSLRKHKTYRNFKKSDTYSDKSDLGKESGANMFRDSRVDPHRGYPYGGGGGGDGGGGRAEGCLDSSASRLTLPSLALDVRSPYRPIGVDGGVLGHANGQSFLQDQGNYSQPKSEQNNGGDGGENCATTNQPPPVSRQHSFHATRSTTPFRFSEHCTNVLNGIELSLINVQLPTNTEGAIPQLWDIKQRLNEVRLFINI